MELAAGELPGIHLDGINISLAEELLVDAPGGRVEVSDSRLDVGTDEVGGRIALTGDSIVVDGESELIATGKSGGGLIEVGGSWQNSDASVRQAITTQIEQGAVLDASAIVEGDGGEIVAWSDITNPDSVTTVAGTLLASGGREGGDGGRIETSGTELHLEDGLEVQAGSLNGEAGLWLQDPYDYTIDDSAAAQISLTLNSGTNVTVTTTANNSSQGATEEGSGDITVSSTITKSDGTTAILTLEADSDILINQAITSTGDNALGLTAKAAGKILLNDDVQIFTKGGDIVLWSNTENVESGSGEHFIRLNKGVNLTSGGGKIILAGGSDSNSDGYPDGYAYIGDTVIPPGSAYSGAAPFQPGLSLGSVRDQTGGRINIQSNGGDITMRGRSSVASPDADGFGSQRAVVIDSGLGQIQLAGDQSSSSGGVGVRFGGFSYFPDVVISSASTSTPAIDIIGTGTDRPGLWLGQGTSNPSYAGTFLVQSAATTGGGIDIEGSNSSSSSGQRGIALWGKSSGHSGEQEYQFISNNGPINFRSSIDSINSEIGIYSDIYLGLRKDSTPVQDVTPIVGSDQVISRFAADTGVYFSHPVKGGGFIEILPYTSGKSLGINCESGDFNVYYLKNLSDTFSGLTIGDAEKTNGIISIEDISVEVPTTLNSGTSSLSLTEGLSSSNDSITFNVAAESTVGSLELGSGSLTKVGAGNLILNGVNSYTGSTYVTQGTLTVTGVFPTSASCSQGATSNICPVPDGPSDSPEPEVLTEEVIATEPEIIVEQATSSESDPSAESEFEPEPEPEPELVLETEQETEPEVSQEKETRGIDIGLTSSNDEDQVVDSILLAQSAPKTAAPTTVAPTMESSIASSNSSTESSGGVTTNNSAAAAESSSEGGDGSSIAASEGEEGRSDGSDSETETSSAESDSSDQLEATDPAALTPASLSGDGYEVSLGLESSFQMADSGSGSTTTGSTTSVSTTSTSSDSSTTSSQVTGASASISDGDGSSASISDGGGTEVSSSSEADSSSSPTTESGTEEGGSTETSSEVAADDGSGGDDSSGESANSDEESGSGTAEAEDDGEVANSDNGEDSDGDAGGNEVSASNGDSESGGGPKQISAAVNIKRVGTKLATQNLATGDAKATSRALQGLNLPDIKPRQTPTPTAIVNSLQQVRDKIISGLPANSCLDNGQNNCPKNIR